ncbi:MAG: hypothetical protein K8R02_00545 [Anaerohalosphaeraceae bacterium]|nr:hypothetical protein [Anaerohalosphaeraceae bacterium]
MPRCARNDNNPLHCRGLNRFLRVGRNDKVGVGGISLGQAAIASTMTGSVPAAPAARLLYDADGIENM